MKKSALRVLDLLTWVWGLWSLYPVARYGGAVLFDPSTTSRIMSVRSGEQIDSAIGLTYTGLVGALLVVTQLVFVGAALVLSSARHTLVRRTSNAILVAWTLLWLGNSVWMEQLSNGRHVSRTSLVVAACFVVMARAAMRFNAIDPRES